MALINNPTIKFDPSNLSAFGEIEVEESTPIFQADWVYGLNSQLWLPAVVSGTGASVDTDSARLRIQSGTDSAGYAYLINRRSVRYRAGQGMVARFTPVFTTGSVNNIQLWGMGNISSNLPYDGYFFGFNGTVFSIAHYNRSSAPTWIAQSLWNGDKVDGSSGTSFNYNPAFGTPAMIKYPYLGFGDIEFFLQNPLSGRWVLVHTIRYANTTATTQLSNPTLHFIGFTANSGNTSNKTIYCGSVGVFLSGLRSFAGSPKWALDSNKSSITTETCLLNIKNCTTYNGVTNRGLLRFNSLSFANGNTVASIAVVRFKIGAAIGGSPSYVPVSGSSANQGVTITSGNSIASYDTAGTTVSGGMYIYNASVANAGQGIIDLTPFNIFVAPGEILTISGFSTNTAILSVSTNWTEDI